MLIGSITAYGNKDKDFEIVADMLPDYAWRWSTQGGQHTYHFEFPMPLPADYIQLKCVDSEGCGHMGFNVAGRIVPRPR